MKSKLSFVIISYNEKEYLTEAIESCFKQNLEDFEIVIGDDGSSDGSVEIIEKYATAYPDIVKYFVSDRSDVCKETLIASLRVSAVIERALKMATGEYCVILSGDDYFLEGDFFRNAITYLDDNSEYAAYVGGYRKVWPDQQPVQFYSEYSPKLYWAGKYIHLTSFVFRKAVFDQGAFLQRFCDDAGLVYSLAFSGKWKYEKCMVFDYRQRSSSIMHTVDQLEFRIVELMILQDVLCKGHLVGQSVAHFSKSLWYVFKHRDELANAKYQKYLNNCEKYGHNVIRQLYEFDHFGIIKKIGIYARLIYAKTMSFVYRVVFKLKER